MADKKISELVELTSLAADDALPIVDADANATKRVKYSTVSSGVRNDIVSTDLPVGSVIQAVSTSTSTTVINATTTYVDTGLAASITPTSASNNLVVMFSQHCYTRIQGSRTSGGLALRLYRGGSVVWRSDDSSAFANYLNGHATGDGGIASYASGQIIVSAGSTSSQTFTMQGRAQTTDVTAHFQVDGGSGAAESTILIFEVVA